MDRNRVESRVSRRHIVKLGATGAALAEFGMPDVIRAQGSPVKLSFFYPVGVAGPLAKIMQGMVDEFNKAHPDIHVEASFTGSYVDNRTKIVTTVQAKNPPDVAVMNATDLQTLLDLKAIVAFDDIKAAAIGDDAKDFFPAFFQDTQMEGKTWSLPFQRSTPVLYYNKDALQKVGLDPAAPPQTWSDLVTAGKKVMDAKTVRWGIEIPSTGGVYWQYQALAIEAGQDLNGKDHAHVNFDTPAAIEALTWMVDLSQKDGVMAKGVLDWSAAPTDFSSANTAFLYHSTGSLTSIRQQAKFQFGTAFLPKDKQFGTNTGGGNIYIFKDVPKNHQEAALTFAQWMTSTDQATSWSINTGYVPVRVSSTKSKTWTDYVAKVPQATTAIDQLKYAVPELTGHQVAQIQKFCNDAVQAAVAGQKSPADALKYAQEQADAVLKQYR